GEYPPLEKQRQDSLPPCQYLADLEKEKLCPLVVAYVYGVFISEKESGKALLSKRHPGIRLMGSYFNLLNSRMILVNFG
ncbi:MAG: hypothetical protein WBD26_13775, partial [Candidatus Acidiferrales bacterium]